MSTTKTTVDILPPAAAMSLEICMLDQGKVDGCESEFTMVIIDCFIL